MKTWELQGNKTSHEGALFGPPAFCKRKTGHSSQNSPSQSTNQKIGGSNPSGRATFPLKFSPYLYFAATRRAACTRVSRATLDGACPGTTHQRKVIAPEAYSLEIVDQIPLTGKTAKTIYQAL